MAQAAPKASQQLPRLLTDLISERGSQPARHSTDFNKPHHRLTNYPEIKGAQSGAASA